MSFNSLQYRMVCGEVLAQSVAQAPADGVSLTTKVRIVI